MALLEALDDGYTGRARLFFRFIRSRAEGPVDGFSSYVKSLEAAYARGELAVGSCNVKIAAAKARTWRALREDELAGLDDRAVRRVQDLLGRTKSKKRGSLALPADRVIAPEDIALPVRETTDTTTAAFIEVMGTTGARISEAIGISLADCTKGSRGSYSLGLRGKGGKERVVFLRAGIFERLRHSLEERPSSSSTAGNATGGRGYRRG